MAKYIALDKLLDTPRDVNLVIARVGGAKKTWGDWLLDVKHGHQFFSGRNEKTWALYCDDTYEFLVLLFSIWAANKVACVPGSNQPAVVESLSNYVDGFVGDFSFRAIKVESTRIKGTSSKNAELKVSEYETVSGLFEIKKITTAAPLIISSSNESHLNLPLNLNDEMLHVFTSGSSGEPELIPKALSQLNAEINNIHLLWETYGRDAIVFSTVTHHHIYGLLFRALWPLAEGNCFDGNLSEFFEDVSRRSNSAEKIILVSSPTHLSRLSGDGDWSELKKACNAIFSSGAPLPKQASLDANKYFGFRPIEVFGSSETGGIAWRQQQEHREEKWKPFPGIELAIEADSQCLKIRSPYLPPQQKEEWYMTSDKVQFDENSDSFQLLGRVDNIVKIEGKRVSINEMERRVKDHDWIADARAVVLSGSVFSSGPGNRTEIGIVAVLSAAGNDALKELSRLQFNKAMQAYLLNYFERPVLPRRWRMVEALPFNTQGKVTLKSLLDLFSKSISEAKKIFEKYPEVFDKKITDDELLSTTVTYFMRAPENLLYFDGHFDAVPILPGVVQLDWAVHYGKKDLPVEGSFLNMEAIKFQNVIRANQKFMLELKYNAEKQKLHFKYYSESGAHSSGRIVFKSKESD